MPGPGAGAGSMATRITPLGTMVTNSCLIQEDGAIITVLAQHLARVVR